MKEETLYPTNFLFSISPDGRIESIKTFGNNAEGDDEAEAIKTLFTATLQSRNLSPDLHDRATASVMVSVFPDGRFKTFQASNTPMENWDLNWHKSQHEKLLHSYMSDPDSSAISDVEIAPNDPEAEKKYDTVKKMGEVIPVRPKMGKNRSNQRSPNGTTPSHPPELVGWFGNAKKIPLPKDDANFNEKKAALVAAGFSFSAKERLWTRP